MKTENRRTSSAPPVLPAYQVAERRLLAQMLQDRGYGAMRCTRSLEKLSMWRIMQRLLLIYMLIMRKDMIRMSAGLSHRFRMIVSRGRPASILMMDDDFPFDEQLLDDYINEIRKVPQFQGNRTEERRDGAGRTCRRHVDWRHKLQLRL